jgi:branched-chain amino acid transport system permease protein
VKAPNTALKLGFCVVLLAVLAGWPFVVSNAYYLSVLSTILVNVILAGGLWLILMTGQVSLGHGGFAAIGGFISAGFVTAYGMNSWLAMLLAMVTSGVVGLVIGYMTLRIRGVYFIIATLALGEFIRIAFGMWDHPFGGLRGIMDIPNPDSISIPHVFTLNFASNRQLYFLTLVLAIMSIIVLYRIYAGPIGRIFRGIKQADELAEHAGVNIMRYKVLVFVVACVLAGLAGTLYTYSTRYMSPTAFMIPQSAYYLLCIAVGGATSIAGPILGAVFLGIFAEIIRPVQVYQPIAFGILLIICVLYFKSGIFGIWQKVARSVVQLVQSKTSDARPGSRPTGRSRGLG